MAGECRIQNVEVSQLELQKRRFKCINGGRIVTRGIGRGDGGVEHRHDAVEGVAVAVEADVGVDVVCVRAHHCDRADGRPQPLERKNACGALIRGMMIACALLLCRPDRQ